MEFLAFSLLVATSSAVLLKGFLRPNGYMQVPFLTAAVFLGWVVPQLWSLRKFYSGADDSQLTTLHLFCLICLLATVVGWGTGKSSARKAATPRAPVSDSTLVNICIVITALAVLMSVGIGSRALEERASATWSGPLTIMYFFSNLKVISLFLSIYLTLKTRGRMSRILLALNVLLYAPIILLAFRRRAILELFTCVVLALWFARRTIVPRVIVLATMPIGMLLVFSVGELRQLSLGEGGDRTWVALSDLAEVEFLEATPFTDRSQSSELNNALNIVRFSDGLGIHTYGATSWNRIVFQWVPAQVVGAATKQALMIDDDVSRQIAERYREDARIGSTPTAMGEAYLEFWFFGAAFFLATAFVMGRWWRQSHQGDSFAMILYASGLALAALLPTAYAIYFFNNMLLYGGAAYVCAQVLAVRRRSAERRHRMRESRRFRDLNSRDS